MKVFSVILMAISTMINLSACSEKLIKQSDVLGGGEYLTNDIGAVLSCSSNLISIKNKLSEADIFWKENNLPKGTTKFVCKDGKAYLHNKVTNCQGNLIYQMEGGLKGFQKRYNLDSNGSNIFFSCINNRVKKVSINFI